jgi:glutaminyl-peptide cyclotransferase
MRRSGTCILVSCAVLALISCGGDKPDEPSYVPAKPDTKPAVKSLSYTVIRKYPHDVKAFTEGLLFHNGKLLESTGSPDNVPGTRSVLGIVDLASGKIDEKVELDTMYFGEGIGVVGDKLFQVTWRNQKGFIYNVKTFKQTGQFSYANREGWGLTSDGKSLIMSDGTYNLTWFEPAALSVEKTVAVTKGGYAVDALNELEWIDGFIYANVWLTNRIVKIDPATGVVVAEADLTDLFNQATRDNIRVGEMNGIAHNPSTGQVLVTGKLWPWIYEIKFN